MVNIIICLPALFNVGVFMNRFMSAVATAINYNIMVYLL